jgi:hypothetical protein
MSKNTSPQAKPKADIDFEKELWDAANELRGAVAENQYRGLCTLPALCQAPLRTLQITLQLYKM